ncbi:hypothetical protein A2U01_0093062, partial [Trifolium medium]|nr:hypothetical protein [Trifolium medium]
RKLFQGGLYDPNPPQTRLPKPAPTYSTGGRGGYVPGPYAP